MSLIVNPVYNQTDDYTVQELNDMIRAYAQNDEVLKTALLSLAQTIRDDVSDGSILTPEDLSAIIDQMLDRDTVYDDPYTSPYTESRHDQDLTMPPDVPRYYGEILAIFKKEPWKSLIEGAKLQPQNQLKIFQLFDFIRGLLFWVYDGTNYPPFTQDGAIPTPCENSSYEGKPVRVPNSTGQGFMSTIKNPDGDYLVINDMGEPLTTPGGADLYEPLPTDACDSEYITLLHYRLMALMARHLRKLYRISAFEAGVSSNTDKPLGAGYLEHQVAWTDPAALVTTSRQGPPVVSAGSDRYLLAPGIIAMTGAFGIDGLDGPVTSILWEVQSEPNPGDAVITDDTDPETDINFTQPGTYTLTLTVETANESATDIVTVTAEELVIGTLPSIMSHNNLGGTYGSSQFIGGDQYQVTGGGNAPGLYVDNYVLASHQGVAVPGSLRARVDSVAGSIVAGIMVRSLGNFGTSALIGLSRTSAGVLRLNYRQNAFALHAFITLGSFPADDYLRIDIEDTGGTFLVAKPFRSSDGVTWVQMGTYSLERPVNNTFDLSMGIASTFFGGNGTAVFDNFDSTWLSGAVPVTPKNSAGLQFKAVENQPIQAYGVVAKNDTINPDSVSHFWQAIPAAGVVFSNQFVQQPTVTFPNTGIFRLVYQTTAGPITDINEVLVNVVATTQLEGVNIPRRFSCGFANKTRFLYLRRDAAAFARSIDVDILHPNNGGEVGHSLIQEETYVNLPMGLLRIPRCLIRFADNTAPAVNNGLSYVTLHAEIRVYDNPSDTGWQDPFDQDATDTGETLIMPLDKDLGMGLGTMPVDGLLSGGQKQTLEVAGRWRYQHGGVIGHIVDGQARYIAIRLGIRRYPIDPVAFFNWLKLVSSDLDIDELRQINASSTDLDQGIWHTVGLSNRLIGQYVSDNFSGFSWDPGQLASSELTPADLDIAGGSRALIGQIPLLLHVSKNDRPFSLTNLNGATNILDDAWSIRKVSSVQQSQNTMLFDDGQGGIENFPDTFVGANVTIYKSDGTETVTTVAQKRGDVLAVYPDGALDGVLPGDIVVIDRQVAEDSLDGAYRQEANQDTVFDLRSRAIAPIDAEVIPVPGTTSPSWSPQSSPYGINPGPGDLDSNAIVDRTDVNDLIANWSQGTLDIGFQAGWDYDASGDIGLGDLQQLALYYGNQYSPAQSPGQSPALVSPWSPLPMWFLERQYNRETLRAEVELSYRTIFDAIEQKGRFHFDQGFIAKASNRKEIINLRDGLAVLKQFLLDWINNYEQNREKPWIQGENILVHWPEKNLEETGSRQTVVPLSRYQTTAVASDEDKIIIDELEHWGDVPQLVKHWNDQDHVRFPSFFIDSLTFVSEKSFTIPGHTKLAGTFGFSPEDTQIVNPLVKVTLVQDQIIGGLKREVYLGSFEYTLGQPSSFANVDGVFLLDDDATYNPVTNRIRMNYSSILNFDTEQPGRVTFSYSYYDTAIIHPLFQFVPGDYGIELSHMANAQMFVVQDGTPQRLFEVPDPAQPDQIIFPLLRLEGISNNGGQMTVRWNRDDVFKLISQGGFIRSWWVIRGVPWIQINEVTYDDLGQATDVEYDAFWVNEAPTITPTLDNEDRAQSWYEPCEQKYAWTDIVQTDIQTEALPFSDPARFVFYQKQSFINEDGSLKVDASFKGFNYVLELPPLDYRWTQQWDFSTTGYESLNSMAVVRDLRTDERHVVFGIFRDGINAGSTALLDDELTLGTTAVQEQVYFRRPDWFDEPDQFTVDFVGMVAVINDTQLDSEARTNNKISTAGYWYAGHDLGELAGLLAPFGPDGVQFNALEITKDPLFWRIGDVPHSYLYRWNNLLQVNRDRNRLPAPPP